jgi:pimeloyl-ACP methyl ester carboxylesterase
MPLAKRAAKLNVSLDGTRPKMTSHGLPLVVLLSGLGADGRLFAAQREVFPDLVAPEWLPPTPRENLPSYASRMAGKVPVARPLVLGGCSFGGMVACEMARILRPDALVLIGSAAARCEIPAYLRVMAILSRAVPLTGFRLIERVAPSMACMFGVRDAGHRRLFAEMLQSTSPEFLRWACRAIGEWKPLPLAGIRSFTICGDKDHILPIGRRSVDITIRGGGHLLPLTHATEVNDLLRRIRSETLA